MDDLELHLTTNKIIEGFVWLSTTTDHNVNVETWL